MKITLPEPLCTVGFTGDQIKEMFGTIGTERFYRFMVGQTYARCDGTRYDHETKKYSDSECKHDRSKVHSIYYIEDVLRFIKGLPCID